jgi:hypothetical protein
MTRSGDDYEIMYAGNDRYVWEFGLCDIVMSMESILYFKHFNMINGY